MYEIQILNNIYQGRQMYIQPFSPGLNFDQTGLRCLISYIFIADFYEAQQKQNTGNTESCYEADPKTLCQRTAHDAGESGCFRVVPAQGKSCPIATNRITASMHCKNDNVVHVRKSTRPEPRQQEISLEIILTRICKRDYLFVFSDSMFWLAEDSCKERFMLPGIYPSRSRAIYLKPASLIALTIV